MFQQTCQWAYGFGGYAWHCANTLVQQVPWQYWYNLGPHFGTFGWY